MRTAAYERYMGSLEWVAKRQQALTEAGHRCSNCGDGPKGLEVHHLTYERLGHELPSDLEVLCGMCHRLADEERKDRVAANQWERRLDAWATKVYGDDWTTWPGEELAHEAFEAWLERKDLA